MNKGLFSLFSESSKVNQPAMSTFTHSISLTPILPSHLISSLNHSQHSSSLFFSGRAAVSSLQLRSPPSPPHNRISSDHHILAERRGRHTHSLAYPAMHLLLLSVQLILKADDLPRATIHLLLRKGVANALVFRKCANSLSLHWREGRWALLALRESPQVPPAPTTRALLGW